jgi:hypothetical protein
MKWLSAVAKAAGPRVLPLAVQIALTTAASSGLLSVACQADVLRLLGNIKL